MKDTNSSVESAKKALDKLLNQKFIPPKPPEPWYKKIFKWFTK